MAGARMNTLMAVVLLGACLIPRLVSCLDPNYYDDSCPGVEDIVRSVVAQQINETFDTVPKTMHFYFQDCFLDGCDASILCRTPISNP
ncbi:Peroxidase 73-like protein, partial [Drosera capensis]